MKNILRAELLVALNSYGGASSCVRHNEVHKIVDVLMAKAKDGDTAAIKIIADTVAAPPDVETKD